MAKLLFSAPFPFFGGKSRIAQQVWERLGPDVPAYSEPFAGSAAVLLARPGWHPQVTWTELLNDKDGYISNFWRAVQHDPEQVTHHADWPINENDLHARHAWLVGQKESMQSRLEGDPDWYDTKIAGWWVWGMACWIGGGFCSGRGPWHVVDGELVRTGSSGQGIKRQRVHLGDEQGIKRQLVHLSSSGQGIKRQRVHLSNDGQGIQRQRVHLGDGSNAGTGEQGLDAWMWALAERLKRVRVICGGWTRAVTPVARGSKHNPECAVFLDPPYSKEAKRDPDLYSADSGTVAHDVRQWCIDNDNDPALRIVLCGYKGEGHDMLEERGWTTLRWTTQGGYSHTGDGQGKTNRYRECVWFSPSCTEYREEAE